MATTTHVNDLTADEAEILKDVAKGSFKGDDVGRLDDIGLVQRTRDEWSLTDEGQATLRTIVDPEHPLH